MVLILPMSLRSCQARECGAVPWRPAATRRHGEVRGRVRRNAPVRVPWSWATRLPRRCECLATAAGPILVPSTTSTSHQDYFAVGSKDGAGEWPSNRPTSKSNRSRWSACSRFQVPDPRGGRNVRVGLPWARPLACAMV